MLCLKILNREGISFNGKKDKVHGILFDGAWLWEEYLNTFLSKKEFIHPDNHSRKKHISLFTDNIGRRYPDFYSIEKSTVIDAKYKYINTDNIEDYHQLITYMHVLRSETGILIYPCEEEQCETNELNGYGGRFIKMTHKISSENNNYINFYKKMEKYEADTLKKIRQ